MRLIPLALFLLALGSCAFSTTDKSAPPSPRSANEALPFKPVSIPALLNGSTRPPTEGEAKEQIASSGKSWLFGSGLGKTLANVGTIVVFPPYGLYLLGNAGLTLAGYEPLFLTDALPSTPRKYVLGAYDEVTSVPGRITALVAREEFSSPNREKSPDEDD